ncbi:hypothetical protein CEXT_573661 [Caerostris extrusa]|uniref:Uncharacterized protein n=1 Tax=Caerostris extrusa TaxID=172846 RepID=A0AAV4QA35_CAEEX|nr:hypothetical protein CEXT_573661 [Caerostris extrusa]
MEEFPTCHLRPFLNIGFYPKQHQLQRGLLNLIVAKERHYHGQLFFNGSVLSCKSLEVGSKLQYPAISSSLLQSVWNLKDCFLESRKSN